MKRKLIVTASSDDAVYDQWDAEMRSNPTYKKMERLCNLHGYTLFEAANERYSSGKIRTEVTMQPNPSRGDWAQYLPDIYYNAKGLRTKEFRAQTAAFGTLTLEEYSVFAEAVQHVQLLLEELNEIDLSTLATWRSEE